jgi:predicted ATPase
VIKSIAISNFKNLREVPKLPLEPVNVLIGPNGSGKSSFLQAIDFLKAFFMSSVELYLKEKEWKYKDLPNLRQSQKTIHWDIEVEIPPDDKGAYGGAYSYSVSLSPKRYLAVGKEQLAFAPKNSSKITLLERKGRLIKLLDRRTQTEENFAEIGLPASVMSRLNSREHKEKFPELLHFRGWIQRFQSFLLWDPKVLRMPDRGKHEGLGQSGEHLAPILARLKREKTQAFAKLVSRVKRLFPTVSEISVSGDRGWGWQRINLHEKNDQTIVFNSQQMSDGVLRLLAVTSLLYLDRIPPVITFEEPENGVHPQLIREVVQVLRELTLRKPPNQCQVFFTTHSPYVLDEFYDHPEQVLLVERGKPLEGTTITRLSDRSQLKIVRNVFDNSLGEAWVTGLLGANAGIKG